MGVFEYIEHATFTLVIAVLLSIYFRKGTQNFLRVIVLALKELPGVPSIIGLVLKSEVSSFVQTTALATDVSKSKPRVTLPKTGIPHAELRERMGKLLKREADPEKDGNVFAYTYTLCDENYKLQQDAFDMFGEKTGHSVEHDALVKEFFQGFMHENALNPMIFPALRMMETEAVSMTAAMLNGSSEVVGFLTSGGTESNLMAVKTCRDMGMHLRPHIRRPNIVASNTIHPAMIGEAVHYFDLEVAPITIHPTIDKAAHYFGLEVIHTPVAGDYRADVKAMERAIDSNTVMLCLSAPQYCHGVVDPIEEVSDIALKKGLPLHVDACFGGFMLPWVEKLGFPVPKFDYRCPGVTSISADVHKYGFCVKGASVITYRNADIRKYQIYAYSEWPGGLYGSPSMAGTRPGGNIAAAWAAMNALGESGYLEKAKALMDVTKKMKDKIQTIPGLTIMGNPSMTAFAIGPSNPNINIQAVADAMETRGWKMERNQAPDSIHCSILPHHIPIVDKFLEDLEASAAFCQDNKALAKKGTAGVYGMMANIPDKGIVTDFLVEFFSEVYKCK